MFSNGQGRGVFLLALQRLPSHAAIECMLDVVTDLVIAVDDPRAEDVRAILERHLAFARSVTPPEDVFALSLDGLLDPSITFFSARRDGRLVAIGALRELHETHGELKSMHTAVEVRGQGIGGAVVDHIVGVARGRGYRRLSLETGTMDAFAPARSLYARLGFEPCEPFGPYVASGSSACMTRTLDD